MGSYNKNVNITNGLRNGPTTFICYFFTVKILERGAKKRLIPVVEIDILKTLMEEIQHYRQKLPQLLSFMFCFE